MHYIDQEYFNRHSEDLAKLHSILEKLSSEEDKDNVRQWFDAAWPPITPQQKWEQRFGWQKIIPSTKPESGEMTKGG